MRAVIPGTSIRLEPGEQIVPGHVLVVESFSTGGMHVSSARDHTGLPATFFPGYTGSHPTNGQVRWFPVGMVNQVIPAFQRVEGVTVPRQIELITGHHWYVLEEHLTEPPRYEEPKPLPTIRIGG